MMKKTTMMLAVLAGVLMLCIGSAGATDYWWWEIKVTGKGVQVSADDPRQAGVVFDEVTDGIRETVYALQNPATLQQFVAYQVGDTWEANRVTEYKPGYNTDQNNIITYWWCPQIGPEINAGKLEFCSHAQTQLKKNKAGEVTQGRLTTLGGMYLCQPSMATKPFKAQFGGVRARGKLVDENKVPEDARTALNDAAADK